jgi:hypothetical protein
MDKSPMSIPAILNPQPPASDDASNLAFLADVAAEQQRRAAEHQAAEHQFRRAEHHHAEMEVDGRAVARFTNTIPTHDGLNGTGVAASSFGSTTVADTTSVMSGKLIFAAFPTA